MGAPNAACPRQSPTLAKIPPPLSGYSRKHHKPWDMGRGREKAHPDVHSEGENVEPYQDHAKDIPCERETSIDERPYDCRTASPAAAPADMNSRRSASLCSSAMLACCSCSVPAVCAASAASTPRKPLPSAVSATATAQSSCALQGSRAAFSRPQPEQRPTTPVVHATVARVRHRLFPFSFSFGVAWQACTYLMNLLKTRYETLLGTANPTTGS